jgi:uncharacterized protein
MLPTRRASDYTHFRHLTETILARISGNGWMASIAHSFGWQAELRIDRCALILPTSNPSLPSLKIAFASDFHAGPTTHPETIAKACRALRQLQPDLLLLGGDFVSLNARYIEDVAEALAHIPALFGRYAVLGNHDLWAGDSLIVQRLTQAGIQVLINQNQQLPPPYDHLWICGLDDPTSGQPDAQALFAGATGSRLVVMHSPEGVQHIAPYQFDLAVCGHTHGGQICLPNGRPIWMPRGQLNRRYAAGHFQIGTRPHQRLIVSRGVGCGGLPLRLYAPADIIDCTITWQ